MKYFTIRLLNVFFIVVPVQPSAADCGSMSRRLLLDGCSGWSTLHVNQIKYYTSLIDRPAMFDNADISLSGTEHYTGDGNVR